MSFSVIAEGELTVSSLVNRLDIPSQIIHLLDEKFGLNECSWERKDGQHIFKTSDDFMFTGGEFFMNYIYKAIKNLVAKEKGKKKRWPKTNWPTSWTERNVLVKLRDELEELDKEETTNKLCSNDNRLSGFPLAKPTGLADKASDSSQSSMKNGYSSQQWGH
eukprot:GHVT01103544.1.p1 GENE.GHVT01103544.1~~GHVT01103544.1.p1  ORF type:complete len:162 (-),score=23.16 GHVT01103544.1:113-598(-)